MTGWIGIALGLLIAAKNSQGLLRAEFYAEDGAFWYPQAYEQGLNSIPIPVGGFLYLIQRLVALSSLALPLSWAPTVFACVALFAQWAVARFLLSSRLDDAWPDKQARTLFAVLLVAMPAANEVSGVLTNVHWYLGLLAFLTLAGDRQMATNTAFSDTTILILAGLSGPCSIFLLPAAVEAWSRNRCSITLLRLLLIAGTAAIQITCLAVSGTERHAGPLGATPQLFFTIVGRIPMLAGLGAEGESAAMLWYPDGFDVSLGVLTLLIFFAGVRWGTALLRQFILIGGLMFAAALYSPLIDFTKDQWPILAYRAHAGERYFLYPLLAWWGVLFWIAASDRSWVRRIGRGLVVLTFVVAIPLDWPRWHPDRLDEFRAQAEHFERAAPGEVVEFAVRPGGKWRMVLQKK